MEESLIFLSHCYKFLLSCCSQNQVFINGLPNIQSGTPAQERAGDRISLQTIKGVILMPYHVL